MRGIRLIDISISKGYSTFDNFLSQELRSLEAELDSKQKEQRMAEERLKRREAQLAEREIDLLKRELNMMIQTTGGTPTPKKRKGNFKKKLLKQKEEKNSSVISGPSGKVSIIILSFIFNFYFIT